MLGWIWRMLVGSFDQCQHVWVDRETGAIKDDGRIVGRLYVSKCSVCGKIRTQRVMA